VGGPANTATEATPPRSVRLTPWATHPWVTAGRGTVRFGVFSGPWQGWEVCRDFVQAAEALGFDAFFMVDHPTRFPDCWTHLAALATTTTTIRLGTLVSCVYYRSPGLLARAAADVDRLSRGRLILGVGIGDWRHEFDELGIPMPAPRERQRGLEETIQIVRGVWGASPFSFGGTHFRVNDARVHPPPVQDPRVPLLVAGGGERVTLRQVAQYADASNFGATERVGSAFTLDDVRRKLGALRRHCERLGRPYESVLRSYWSCAVVCAETPARVRAKLARIPQGSRDFWAAGMAVGTPPELVTHYQRLLDTGIQYITAGIWEHDEETARLLAEQVRPHLVLA
jgi:alkanesulfonate monooxygenase SsuD/methylene tetrahydromethanopterin reductase-like flavin-dependent oxidoreductase (luciferase family)